MSHHGIECLALLGHTLKAIGLMCWQHIDQQTQNHHLHRHLKKLPLNLVEPWLVSDFRHIAFRASKLTELRKRRCLKIWCRLENRSDYRRHFMSNPWNSWALIGCMSSLIQYMLIPSFQCHRRSSFWGPVKLALEAVPTQGQQILV